MSNRIRCGALVALALLAACAAPPMPNDASNCSESALADAATPGSLRTLVELCSSSRVAALALRKLNALAPSPLGRLSLRQPSSSATAERVVLEVDLYFNPLESYPPDAALEKLESLLARVNQGYSIESLRIVGGGESAQEGGAAADLARRRADFVRAFLVRAGLPETVSIQATADTPSAAVDAEGRARARVASVQVAVLRNRAASAR